MALKIKKVDHTSLLKRFEMMKESVLPRGEYGMRDINYVVDLRFED